MYIFKRMAARGSVDGWGHMLQAAGSQVRFPLRSLHFSNWRNPYSRTLLLELTHLLTEESTGIFPWSKAPSAFKVNSLTAICEPIV
jgi:hypothetical protein